MVTAGIPTYFLTSKLFWKYCRTDTKHLEHDNLWLLVSLLLELDVSLRSTDWILGSFETPESSVGSFPPRTLPGGQGEFKHHCQLQALLAWRIRKWVWWRHWLWCSPGYTEVGRKLQAYSQKSYRVLDIYKTPRFCFIFSVIQIVPRTYSHHHPSQYLFHVPHLPGMSPHNTPASKGVSSWYVS